ncbi:RNA polymerase, sigma-24 subunit, ECF subfamily [Paenibacillus curdlanolyticus YK9]|uniref:RNA polymerase, sigma-24 subunit, ECF subfamily n=1 Tax=Paenibacillus curdlanolyticus YK9 TaxID=717606 RepID=E0I7W8_9BACL|nr:RNA polymerase sigma factor [Paenibacillus curdlanolyticus]EFM11273.1 RNA polymerase, sigma-24 subunit, ECF subfamily [Paenibacillus curdlanolyticus YK9]
MSGDVRHAARIGEGQDWMASLYAKHHQQLKRFCRKLAGSSWDAEDLAQITWMKVWTLLEQRASGNGSTVSSSYLYRIAANAWTDRCRRKSIACQELTGQLIERIRAEELSAPQASALLDAMERIVAELTPLQRTIMLLMSALQFTAAETAALLDITEGAAKAGLHRARANLLKRRAASKLAGRREVDEQLVYAYLDAFRSRNIHGLLLLLNAGESQDVLPAVQGIRLAPPVRAEAGASQVETGAGAAVESSLYAALDVYGAAQAICGMGEFHVAGGTVYAASGWAIEGWSSADMRMAS